MTISIAFRYYYSLKYNEFSIDNYFYKLDTIKYAYFFARTCLDFHGHHRNYIYFFRFSFKHYYLSLCCINGSGRKKNIFFLNNKIQIKHWIYKKLPYRYSNKQHLSPKKITHWIDIRLLINALRTLKNQIAYCVSHFLIFNIIVCLLIVSLNLITFLHFGWTIKTFCIFYFIVLAMTISGIDFKKKFVPVRSIFFLLVSGLVINLFYMFVSPKKAALGCLVGYLILKIYQKIYYYLTQQDGIGEGDVQLLAALGAWLGPHRLPMLLLLSSVMVMIIAIIRVPFRKTYWKTIIPFGPYLSFSAWLLIVIPVMR